jgi:probable H4MPT-linked C1 transfer pathway protein
MVIGWDIGGAHLKVARLDGSGRLENVLQLPCALWQGMDRLAAACNTILAALPDGPALHAVTMTGEMADLFPDRASGVIAIVSFIKDLLARCRPRDALSIFAGDCFVDAASVHAGPDGNTDSIASANWRATARRCARSQKNGLLVDIGSTTTDLIALVDSKVCAVGADDRERLTEGELVYAGIVRTPLMALAQRVPFAGGWRRTMNEHFATTADVFRILGELDESADSHPAADGGPKTREASARRLMRMLGEDLAGTEMVSVCSLARHYRQRLLDLIADGLGQRFSRGDIPPAAPLIGAGVGRFLVIDLAARCQQSYRSVDQLLCSGNDDAALRARAADCAPAVAVAQLLLETRT